MLKSKDVAELFGVTQSTIYNWEARGYLKPTLVTPTKRKYYSEEEVKKLYDSGLEEEDRS